MPRALMIIVTGFLCAWSACFGGEPSDTVPRLIEEASSAAARARTLYIRGYYSVSSEPTTGIMVGGPTGRIEFELWRDRQHRFVVKLRQDEEPCWTIGWNGHEMVVVDHQRGRWASRRTDDINNAPLLESAADRDRLAQWTYMQIAGTWLAGAASYKQMLENAVRQATRVAIATTSDKGGRFLRTLRIEGAQQSGGATMEQIYEFQYDPRTMHLVRSTMTVTIHAGPLRTRSRRILECEAVQTDLTIDAARLKVPIPEGYARVEAGTHDAAQRLVGLSTRDWTLGLIYPEARRQSFTDFAGGKPVVCLVWATWCGPCKVAMRHLEQMLGDDRTIDGVRVLTIGIDQDRQKLLDYARKHKLGLPVAHDPGFFKARLNGAGGGPPLLFFVDADGRIVSARMGYGPQLRPWLAEQVKQLLGPREKP